VIRKDRRYRVLPTDKRYYNVLSNNCRKLRRIVVIFDKQHQESKEKLIMQRKFCLSQLLLMLLLYLAKWNALL